jgi:glycerol-3-phosphate dehydrogenase
VREALIEREVLLESAPHIIWPMRFVLPHSPSDRPAWLVRLGLFLYDHLAAANVCRERARLICARRRKARRSRQYRKAFEYSDCWVDDARLVLLECARCQAARRKGATRARPVPRAPQWRSLGYRDAGCRHGRRAN